MTRKPWIRISAVVAALALCLSLPRLFPMFAQASAADDPHGFSEINTAWGVSGEIGDDATIDPQQPPGDDTQPLQEGDDPTTGTREPDEGGEGATADSLGQGEGDDNTTAGAQEPGDGGDPTPQQPGADNEDQTPDPQPPGADGDYIPSGPHGAGDDTASEDFDEGGAPPAGTDEDDEDPEGPEAEATEPPVDELEEPLPLGASGLTKSSRTVPGYNVFEVDSYASLAEALSTTSYPSEEYPETSVYILLTGDVTIEKGFILHESIEKVTIDGDGQHTLSEINLEIIFVSNTTVEVKLMDLTIIGNQWFGLFHNPIGTDVTYLYERVTYTGPQILHAANSTAHFTDCDIHITGAGAGTPVNEVAEIRDVYIHGNNQIRHNSPDAVFYLYNSGNLVLSDGATLHINATSANNYILVTVIPQSTLRLEDGATLRIEGTSSQLAAGTGLHSIYLGESAVFDWKAHRDGNDVIAVNSSGGAKDAIYLSSGAEFRVVPNGTPSYRFIRIDSGSVVVGPGASLTLRAVLYTGPYAPLYLAAGSSLTVGNSATFMMDIRNSNQLNGLLTFGGAAGSFSIDRDSTVVIRGNRVTGAVYFGGNGSTMEVNDPNYLEIVTSGGSPIYFSGATAAAPSTLTYTDVQQLNYWDTVNKTYLNGGRPKQRWLADTGALTIRATVSAGGNGSLSTELIGGSLDQDWTATLDHSNFAWSDVRILSAGTVGIEVSADGNGYQGRMTAPTLGVPYSQGTVQLRVGQPKKEKAVSAQVPATPGFYVTPNQTVGAHDEIAVWAEYGYVFYNNPSSAGTLSLSAPAQMEFGTLIVPLSDTEVPAVDAYSLQVQDPRRSGWQVTASFSGFRSADNALNSTLVVNDVPLQGTPQRIAASAGSETVPLDASLLVPGGAARAGTYAGNITWTLVDAP